MTNFEPIFSGSLMNYLPAVIVGVISGLLVSLIVGPRSLKKILRDRERNKTIGRLKDFWITPKSITNFSYGKDQTYIIVCGRERPGNNNEKEPRIAYSEACGILLIHQILDIVFNGNCHIEERFLDTDESFNSNWFNRNVIIFGGQISLKSFGKLCRSLKVPFYQYNLLPENDDRSFVQFENGNEKAKYSPGVGTNREILRDIGTVTRIVDPNNKKLLVLLNGSYAAGLLMATSSITKAEKFDTNGFNPETTAQQLLVSVSNIKNNFITPEHPFEVCFGWKEFRVTENELQNAINTACE